MVGGQGRAQQSRAGGPEPWTVGVGEWGGGGRAHPTPPLKCSAAALAALVPPSNPPHSHMPAGGGQGGRSPAAAAAAAGSSGELGRLPMAPPPLGLAGQLAPLPAGAWVPPQASQVCISPGPHTPSLAAVMLGAI